MFKELIGEPRLCHLLSGWCIDDRSFSIHAPQEYSQDCLTNTYDLFFCTSIDSSSTDCLTNTYDLFFCTSIDSSSTDCLMNTYDLFF
ncbi:28797_t:CDS:2 [Dentiscutata erythropus]|uniref:28797_t:CDS:1 n=1 Tax=Dentiscutata erythropus TaxID=1348616 RepID=A0A9N9FVQ9_9GLOM|nr:28797_t:CDS:2 [Dentiscutata erythropus]